MRGGVEVYSMRARTLPRVIHAAAELALPLVLFRQPGGPSEGVRVRYPVLRRELLDDVQRELPLS